MKTQSQNKTIDYRNGINDLSYFIITVSTFIPVLFHYYLCSSYFLFTDQ